MSSTGLRLASVQALSPFSSVFFHFSFVHRDIRERAWTEASLRVEKYTDYLIYGCKIPPPPPCCGPSHDSTAAAPESSSSDHLLRRRKRSFDADEYIVETTIVADQSMLDYHRMEDLEGYIYTLMNIVSQFGQECMGFVC